MPRSRLSSAAPLLFALLAPTVLAACEVTPEDLEAWSRKEDGAGRLAAAVADGERPLETRTAAARLLVQQGAVPELSHALQRSRPEETQQVVDGLVPTLLELLGGSEEQQVRAKEAIYYLGGHASAATRQQLADALLRWAFEDFAGRYRLGNSTLGQVLPRLGGQAAIPLLGQLRKGQAVQEVTEALLAFGDPEVERATALALVELARKQLPDLPIPVAASLILVRRPELTPLLIEAAADRRVDGKVREALLDHVPACKGPGAAPGLAGLLADPDLRFSAARYLLELEGLEGLRRVLLSLPPAARYPEEDEQLYHLVDFFCTEHVKGLRVSEDQLEQVLLDGLARAEWPGKLVALHCLGRWGSRNALPELTRAASYPRRLPGWKPADTTLGQVARDAAERLRQR